MTKKCSDFQVLAYGCVIVGRGKCVQVSEKKVLYEKEHL